MLGPIIVLIVICTIALGLQALFVHRFRLGIVNEHERALKFVNGKYVGVLGAGSHWHYGRRATLLRVDIRKRLLTVPAQEVITSDGVSLRASLAAQFQVTQPEVALRVVEDYQAVLYSELQSALREVLSGMDADAALEQRGIFGPRLLEIAKPGAAAIGVDLQAVHVKDLMLPTPLKNMFAQVVQARKEGQAALERARGEAAAMRSLANTARLLQQNPQLYNLRLLQSIGESRGNTIVVGVSPAEAPLQAQASPEREVDE